MQTQTPTRVQRRAFHAMGTSVVLIAPGDARTPKLERALHVAERAFAEQEQRFSRFRNDSELSKVNRSEGRPTRVSGPFGALVARALRAAAATDGLFDPTVLPAMVAAGYDRTFEDVIVTAREVLRPAAPTGRWREIVFDLDVLTLPEGVGLDLGGIAKGWTADIAARRASEILPWGIVDAGGDMRAFGEMPPEGLEIGVEHPFDAQVEVLRLALTHGALASSSIVRRSWGPNLHHLIDPRTGRPASTDVVQASVWADTCVEAEVEAKVALLRGVPALRELAATLVLEDGSVVTSMPAAA
jgi:thiamine biosynthesis lipoprotein